MLQPSCSHSEFVTKGRFGFNYASLPTETVWPTEWQQAITNRLCIKFVTLFECDLRCLLSAATHSAFGTLCVLSSRRSLCAIVCVLNPRHLTQDYDIRPPIVTLVWGLCHSSRHNSFGPKADIKGYYVTLCLAVTLCFNCLLHQSSYCAVCSWTGGQAAASVLFRK